MRTRCKTTVERRPQQKAPSNDAEIIQEFITSGLRNKWLDVEFGRVYCRNSRRMESSITGQRHTPTKTFDVATVVIAKIHQSQGHFKRLLSLIEKVATANDFKMIYLENVLNNARLERYYLSQGYTKIENSYDINHFSPCFAKLVGKSP